MQRILSLKSPRLLPLLAVFSLVFAQNALAHEMANHTAKFVQNARDMGSADASQVITVKVHLQGRNSDGLSDFIQQLHDPSSANFQKWLTPDQFKATFGATADANATVRNFLTAKNLKVVSSDGKVITVQGTIGDFQSAFQTPIHQFQVNGNLVRANIRNPVVDEPAGAMVSAISGLTQVIATPHHVFARDANGNAAPPIPLDSLGANGLFVSPDCFRDPQTVNLSGVVANFPPGNPRASQQATATYNGARLVQCGYQPSEIQKAYKFNQLFSEGLDGTGQSIVIVDAFGSPTIARDIAIFDSLYGLPAAQITTFVVNVTGVPPGQDGGWAGETTLDVEWAHAVAPGAKIVLVLAADPSFDNLNAAVQFAIEKHLGPVVSNSYGAPENLIDGGTFAATEAVLAEGAAAGVSVNYSSGDSGDFSVDFGPGITTVSYPASSPFATAIGGTSLAVNADNSIRFQTGWGNNETLLSLGNNPVVPPSNDPAFGLGFAFGAGGGASSVFAKRHFQRRQPGCRTSPTWPIRLPASRSFRRSRWEGSPSPKFSSSGALVWLAPCSQAYGRSQPKPRVATSDRRPRRFTSCTMAPSMTSGTSTSPPTSPARFTYRPVTFSNLRMLSRLRSSLSGDSSALWLKVVPTGSTSPSAPIAR